MTQDLILRVTNNGVTTDLDIDSNIPLRLDMSAVENQEIGQVYGIASQNFSLPGTKKNNRFFNHGYKVSATDIPALYNTIECYVLSNGETLIEGQLQLIDIVTDGNGFIIYNVLVTDSAVEFNAELGDKLIKNADFSSYDHTLTSGSIIQSWTTPISGAVFYPIADYGADEFSVFPSEPVINFSGEPQLSGSIDNPSSPMSVYQFLPAIKLNKVVEAICSQAGFEYSSSFLDSSDFDRIYMLNKAKEDLGIVGSVQENTLIVSKSVNTTDQMTGPIVVPDDREFKIIFGSEVADPGNAYNNTTGIYTAPYAGAYFIDINVLLDYDFVPGVADVRLEFSRTSDGFIIASGGTVTNTMDAPYTGSLNLGLNARVELDKGTEYQVDLNINVTDIVDPGNDLDFTFKSGSQFSIPRALSIYDDAPVSMSLQFDSELKSVDVFKGILEHFNLVAYVDPTQNRVLKIEQLDQWIRSGEIKDWTQKYDTAERIAISHTVDEQPRTLLFQQAEDADRFSKIAQESEPNFQYGTLRALSDSNVTTGETEIGKFFAPIVLSSCIDYGGVNFSGVESPIIGDSNFILPQLYKFENNERNSFKFKPRIGYAVTSSIPPDASNSTIFIGNSGSAQPVTGSYGTISNVNALPVISGSTNDLQFNNTYPSYVPSSFLINSGSNNFTNYWKTYTDSLYAQNGRKVILDLYFTPQEYKSIKLNDRIQIKNQMYRINKIKGFNVSDKDVVTVELLKLFPAYWQLDAADVPPPVTPTPTPSPTSTPDSTPTSTPTQTPTPTGTPTNTPTNTPTPSVTPTNTPTPTQTPTNTPTSTPTPTPSSAASYYGPFGIIPESGESGETSSTLACNQITAGQVYFEFPTSPANGDVAYNNTALDDIFIGDGNWYGIDTTGDGDPDVAFQISSLGVLSNETTCP